MWLLCRVLVIEVSMPTCLCIYGPSGLLLWMTGLGNRPVFPRRSVLSNPPPRAGCRPLPAQPRIHVLKLAICHVFPVAWSWFPPFVLRNPRHYNHRFFFLFMAYIWLGCVYVASVYAAFVDFIIILLYTPCSVRLAVHHVPISPRPTSFSHVDGCVCAPSL